MWRRELARRERPRITCLNAGVRATAGGQVARPASRPSVGQIFCWRAGFGRRFARRVGPQWVDQRPDHDRSSTRKAVISLAYCRTCSQRIALTKVAATNSLLHTKGSTIPSEVPLRFWPCLRLFPSHPPVETTPAHKAFDVQAQTAIRGIR